jgi:hypothetical protein
MPDVPPDRAGQGARGGRPRRRAGVLARPKGFTVEQVGSALRITRRWFWPSTIALYCLLAPSFLWLGITRSSALPTILGMVFVYALALFVFNRTVIEVTDTQVVISHGPIPSLLKRQLFDAHELVRLYCHEDSFHEFGSADIDYELRARTVGGNTVVLLSDIPDLRQAQFLERQLAARLGIAEPPPG